MRFADLREAERRSRLTGRAPVLVSSVTAPRTRRGFALDIPRLDSAKGQAAVATFFATRAPGSAVQLLGAFIRPSRKRRRSFRGRRGRRNHVPMVPHWSVAVDHTAAG